MRLNLLLFIRKHDEMGKHIKDLGPVSQKSRKAIRKTATRLFCKNGLFIIAKGIKIKITAKFRASRRLRFKDTKRIMSSDIRPKSLWTLEKRAPGPSFSNGG